MEKLRAKLKERESAGNLRQLTLASGKKDFFSNDYFGLARNQKLAQTIQKRYTQFSGKINGSTGSRLLSGNHRFVEELEQKLAGIFLTESTLIFNSGYNANLAILSSVPQKGDTILYDELIHSSLKDGSRLSFANRFSFRHNDLEDLENKLSRASGEKFIVAEAVYSMDGDLAPLEAMIVLAEKHGAHLILDEAHSTGTWGNSGSGLACAYGLQNRIFARIHTFGKAMGVHGACIAGSSLLREFLINFARPFIYTTALPLHSLVSIEQAFEFLKKNEILQTQLRERINFFRSAIKAGEGSGYVDSESSIQVLKIPGNTLVKKLAIAITESGFDVRPILSPTVKEGEERLRICLHTFNTPEEINTLARLLETQVPA